MLPFYAASFRPFRPQVNADTSRPVVDYCEHLSPRVMEPLLELLFHVLYRS